MRFPLAFIGSFVAVFADAEAVADGLKPFTISQTASSQSKFTVIDRCERKKPGPLPVVSFHWFGTSPWPMK